MGLPAKKILDILEPKKKGTKRKVCNSAKSTSDPNSEIEIIGSATPVSNYFRSIVFFKNHNSFNSLYILQLNCIQDGPIYADISNMQGRVVTLLVCN